MLSLAPGKLVSFRHNKRTIQLLKDHGYHVISAHKEEGRQGFLDWSRQEVAEWLEDTSRKTLITVRGEELSRACGGPRSLERVMHFLGRQHTSGLTGMGC